MGKRKWDGSFDESKYTETGNIVNDVIENDGRILHEATSDGYTHEMVDRGGYYISDDYYFPQRNGGKKPHIHYELHSNGTVLIDGKPIIVNETGGDMMGPKLSHSLDKVKIDKKSSDIVYESKKLHELGKKFEADKATIEAEMDRIQNSRISPGDKRKILEELKRAIEELQKQYDKEVAQEQEKMSLELQEQLGTMDEAITEFEQQEDSLRSVRLDAAATDTSAAADEANSKKKEFEDMKARYTEELRLKIEQAQRQQRNIQSNRFSGK